MLWKDSSFCIEQKLKLQKKKKEGKKKKSDYEKIAVLFWELLPQWVAVVFQENGNLGVFQKFQEMMSGQLFGTLPQWFNQEQIILLLERCYFFTWYFPWFYLLQKMERISGYEQKKNTFFFHAVFQESFYSIFEKFPSKKFWLFVLKIYFEVISVSWVRK